jgi:predicted metalloprotease with PDZ domain
MPAWAPGAYGIRNDWRNVQEFFASDETGAALKFEKVDKQPGEYTAEAVGLSQRATSSIIEDTPRSSAT